MGFINEVGNNIYAFCHNIKRRYGDENNINSDFPAELCINQSIKKIPTHPLQALQGQEKMILEESDCRPFSLKFMASNPQNLNKCLQIRLSDFARKHRFHHQ
jgi:hypothetical protein